MFLEILTIIQLIVGFILFAIGVYEYIKKEYNKSNFTIQVAMIIYIQFVVISILK